METKHPTSMRLGEDTQLLVALCAKRLRISQRAVIELAIHHYAHRLLAESGHFPLPPQGESDE